MPLTETAINSKPCIVHREGAGVVTLRGLTNQCRALYKVTYGGNIAIPTGGAVGAITAALAVNGEALTSATATVTPATVENYFNIYVSAQVCVPNGCCLTVAMKNTKRQIEQIIYLLIVQVHKYLQTQYFVLTVSKVCYIMASRKAT